MKYNLDLSLNKQQELTDLHSTSKSVSIAASVAEQRVLYVIKTLMAVLLSTFWSSDQNWKLYYLSTESFVPTPPAK